MRRFLQGPSAQAGEKDGYPRLARRLPLVGHVPWLLRDLRGVLDAAERQLGPMFWLDLSFGFEVLLCRHPDGLGALRNKATTSTHYQQQAGALLGDSLIVHDGSLHQHLRSALNGPFTPKGLQAAAVGAISAEMITARVQAWAERPHIAVLGETRELALDIIFRIIGIPGQDLGAWRHQYEEFLLNGISIPLELPGMPRWRGRRAQRWLDGRLLAIVAEARRSGRSEGLLGQLVNARDDAGEALTDHELVENLRLLSLAGHETSATTMAWLVIELGRDPERWERLVAEALAAGGVPETPRELRQFPFAEALFRETLRLHAPVSSVTRQVTGPLAIAGRTIAPGVTLGIDLDRLSRHEAVYEEPERFRPERWLGKSEAPTPIEVVQFGGGPHFCLGYHFAWMEVVQFAVALGRILGARGRAPVLEGRFPRTYYLPLAHPAARTRVRIERGGRRAG